MKATLKETRLGKMLFLPNDRYVGRSLDLYGEYSEEEASLFRGLIRQGAVVVDAGAHVGPHTLALAKTVGPSGAVIALEPQRILLQMLCANVALNGHSNVWCYHAAAGSREGTIGVPVLDYDAGNNFAGLSLAAGIVGEQVRLMTIDSLRLERCDFMKIDVEGMESEAIEGARETIRRFRPALYVENDREEKSPALIELIGSMGFRMYWHRPPLFSPSNFFGNPVNVFEGVVSINMLCLHESLGARVEGLEPVM